MVDMIPERNFLYIAIIEEAVYLRKTGNMYFVF